MSAPSPMSANVRPWYRRKPWVITGAVVGVLLLCCTGLTVLGLFLPKPAPKPPSTKVAASPPAAPATTAAPSSSPSTRPSPTSASARPATSPPTLADSMICKVTTGGTYYLNVTSATAHNFAACAGAQPFPGTLDDLLALPNMDRRCLAPADYVAQQQALVGVYSDTAAANLAAANSYCRTNGWSNT